MTARPDVTTPRTRDRRLAPRLQISGATPEQQARWREAAARAGLTLAAWVREACERAADPPPTPREMSEAACARRTLGAGYQDGFEAGVRAERERAQRASSGTRAQD